ncbi:MAG: DedA family protein [Thiovulaceae bacterium]|nr:DedA family protein [Sulfurimonadaceae bacterium]
MEGISSNLATYSYIALFLYSLGGGYVGLIAAGIMSHLGDMNIIISIIVATFANFLGDGLLFYMGRYNKKDMHKYLLKHRRKLALAHVLLKKYGDRIIFIQKYVYGIKTLIPIVIGFTRYNMQRFIFLNAIAAVAWGISVGSASYFAGSVLVPIVDYLGDHFYLILLFLAFIIWGTWIYMKKATAKKK